MAKEVKTYLKTVLCPTTTRPDSYGMSIEDFKDFTEMLTTGGYKATTIQTHVHRLDMSCGDSKKCDVSQFTLFAILEKG